MGFALEVRQEPHLFPDISLFDENRADMEYVSEVPSGIDSNKRTTLATASRQIGVLLGKQIQSEAEMQDAEPYVATNDDMQRIGKISLERGLYLYWDDPRRKGARELVEVKSEEGFHEVLQSGLKLPFEEVHFKYQPSVVFPASEFTKVSLNPERLVRSAQAKAQNKNEGNVNRDENRKNADKSARGILRTYIESIDALEAKYSRDFETYGRLFRLTEPSKTPRNQYRSINLVRHMAHADGLFRQMIEVAGINNKWTHQQVVGANHALNEVLYFDGTGLGNDLGWRTMLKQGGMYINARRFKLMQARANCENHLTLHAKDPNEE